MAEYGTMRVKSGLAEMLKGGVIMDVTNAEQARIAEDAGACAVMALERVPADIRVQGGVARMSDPDMIASIQAAVTIPVMAKARIGHFVEAQVLQALEVDYIDESEVLTPADEAHHIDKWEFDVPFVCGATNLGEALRRIGEGAAMIRSKGEAGTGNVVEATRHMRSIKGEIAELRRSRPDELHARAKELQSPCRSCSGSPSTAACPSSASRPAASRRPSDAAMMMQLGADGVFVGSGIFKSGDPSKRARAIVEATTNFRDAKLIAKVSAEHRRADGRHEDGEIADDQLAGHARLVSGWRDRGARAPGCVPGALRRGPPPRRTRRSRCGRRPSWPASTRWCIPGGESTTIDKLLDWQGLREPLQGRLDAGMPTFGTCAGLIVLAASAVDGLPGQRPLAAIDIVAQRNGFGRQVRSFEAPVLLQGDEVPMTGVFIRAPRIVEAGDDVEIIATMGDEPVAAASGTIMVATFHPELTDDDRLHRLLLRAGRGDRPADLTEDSMSGHSKWASIKHKKGATDKKRGQLFSKLSRAIMVAVKEGGPNVADNLALQNAVQKARDFSMPKDNIERAIERASASSRRGGLRDRRLRGLRPGRRGVRGRGADRQPQPHRRQRAVVLQQGRRLARQTGSVAFLFDRKGVIVIEGDADEEDTITMTAAEGGAEDVRASLGCRSVSSSSSTPSAA